jgi:hypothetical protein
MTRDLLFRLGSPSYGEKNFRKFESLVPIHVKSHG